MKRRLLSIIICLVMIVSLVPAAALADSQPVAAISAAVKAPTFGETPDMDPTFETVLEGAVTLGTVYWFKIDKTMHTGSSTDPWEEMTASETFDMNHYYKVNMSVSAADGYYFQNNVKGTVNGQQCEVNTSYMALGMNVVFLTYVFKDVQPVPITAVNLVIPEPKVGDTVSFEPTYESTPADSVETRRFNDGTLFCIWERVTTEQYRTQGKHAFADNAIGEMVNPGDKFEPGYHYQLYVQAEPKSDYYKVVKDTDLTVNGKEPSGAYSYSDHNQTYTFSHIFEPIVPVPSVPLSASAISGLGDKLVKVSCDKTYKYYGLIDGNFTTDNQVTCTEGVYRCNIYLISQIYLEQYNTDTSDTHTRVSQTPAGAWSIGLVYDAENKTWKPDGDVAAMELVVKCDEHEVPAAPAISNISGLSDKLVKVSCDKTYKYYGLIGGNFSTDNQVTCTEGVYRCNIYLISQIYLEQYNTDTSDTHTRVSQTPAGAWSIGLVYDAENKTWKPDGDVAAMELVVKCDEHEVPAAPAISNISGLSDKLVAVLCSNVPGGGTDGKYYGLLDGSFTYPTGPVLVNGVYECTIKLIPSVYCKQYSTDTKIKHEPDSSYVLNTKDPSIVLQYNSETMKWTPKGDPQIIIGVRCDKHVVEYKVMFDANGGSGKMDSVMVEEGKQYMLPECTFTAPAGKMFKAWMIGDMEYSAGSKITVSMDTTVKAVWKLKSPVPGYVTVSFKANGGSGTMKDVSVLRGASYTLPACEFKAPDGKEFKAWKIGLTEYAVGSKITVSMNTTVTAVWKDMSPAPVMKYKVTVTGGSGSGEYAKDATVMIKADKAPEGKLFDKWVVVSGDVMLKDAMAAETSFTMPAKDVELKAMYKDMPVMKYKVTVMNGSGSGEYAKDAMVTVKADKAPEDMMFDKWVVVSGDVMLKDAMAAETSFMMPAKDVELKAMFKAINPFVDVKKGAFYYDAVLWAVMMGVTNGVDDTHFAPDDTCTRAEAVTMLWRNAGSPAPKSMNMPFTDVPKDSYYYDAVLWAVENGIVKGTSATTFSPGMLCSRAHIVTMLHRAAKTPAAGTDNPFTDVAMDAYYYDAVLWAAKTGVTKGTGDNMFSPDGDCTRGQIVTLIWRWAGSGK